MKGGDPYTEEMKSHDIPCCDKQGNWIKFQVPLKYCVGVNELPKSRMMKIGVGL
jgi:hypothetical protein